MQVQGLHTSSRPSQKSQQQQPDSFSTPVSDIAAAAAAAASHLLNEEYLQALRLAQSGLKHDAKDSQCLYNCGLAYMGLGHYGEAFTHLKKADKQVGMSLHAKPLLSNILSVLPRILS